MTLPWHQKHPGLISNLTVVVLVIALQPLLYYVYNFPVFEAQYDGQLLLTSIPEIGKKRILALGLFLASTVVFSIYRPVRFKKVSRLSRYLFLCVIAIQTYTIAFMDFNHYHGEWFLADRILLVALAVYAVINPYSLPLYLIQLVLLTNQLEVPDVVDYDRTHKSLILPILLSFWVFFVLKQLFVRRIRWTSFVLIMLSILSSWYLKAGIAKYQINWPATNNLYNMLAASVDAGWLHTVDTEFLQQVGSFLNKYHVALQYGGLVVEMLLPLLLLLHRQVALVCLAGFIAFHLMVYALSGIFFWQWIVMELIVMGVLVVDEAYADRLFTWENRLIYFTLLLINPLFVQITKLAWLDCGYINSYTFYLLDDQGKQKKLDSSFFAPYDVGFAKNRFYYLREEKHLARTLGQCYDPHLVLLTAAWGEHPNEENIKNVNAYRSAHGMDDYQREKSDRFIHFLQTFTRNKLEHDPQLISLIDVPLHMAQGENQQNLSFADAWAIKVVYEEKVVLPKLQVFTLMKDSTTISL